MRATTFLILQQTTHTYIMRFFDGAFGTYYFDKTGDFAPCELANITNEDIVLDIHREYIKAGANAIKTNTFWANRISYENEELKKIINAGYELAMQAARTSGVEVFADIGNIDSGDATDIDLETHYLQIADIFIEQGAVNFIFETLNEFDAIIPAICNIKSRVRNSIILVSFAVSQDGYSRKGLYYKNLISKAAENPNVDITGLNCICGPTHLLNLTKELKNISKPLSVMPNAGYPSTVNGRTIFRSNAEYFSQKLAQIHNLGIYNLGGCCGTTPAHIDMAIRAINAKKEDKITRTPEPKYFASSLKGAERLPPKPLFVELDPPIDSDFGFVSEAVDRLKALGVNTITLTDSPLAKARMDSVMAAAKIITEKNIDVLPHMSCRDKNHIAIKSSLVGAHCLGINKILAVTGDPICDSKKSGVFEFNSCKLIAYIKNLNDAIFMERPLSIGGAINVNALNFDAELLRAKKKLEHGANFLLSQPIYTKTAAENFKRAKDSLNCKLYAGILPVASYKNALFLNNEVSGIEIPADVLNALKDKDPKEVYDISINFSKESIKYIHSHADGFYIMTPLKKIDLVCKLIEQCYIMRKEV